MPNPILQALNQRRPTNNLFASFLGGKSPESVFNSLMQSNAQFVKFVNANKDKSVEQIANEYGISLDTVRSYLK